MSNTLPRAASVGALLILFATAPTHAVSGQDGPPTKAATERATLVRVRELIARLGPIPNRNSDVFTGPNGAELARDELAIIGAPAVLPLCDVLRDKSEWRRGLATEALEKIGDRRAIQPLLRVLQRDSNVGVRQSAARALGEIGDPAAVNALIRALDDRGDELRPAGVQKDAALALGKIGDARALSPLLLRLGSREAAAFHIPAGSAYPLGSYVAEALAMLGEPAVEPLLKTLEGRDLAARAYAAKALGLLRERRAVPRLIALLFKKDEDKEATGNVAYYAIEALGLIGDTRAVDPLLARLKPSAPDFRVAEALGRLKDPRAVEPLLALLPSPGDWTGAVPEALGHTGDARATGPLLGCLKNKSDAIRSQSARALGKIGAAQALPELLALLEDPEYTVRFGAAEAIGRNAPERLASLLREGSPSVRKAAIHGLTRIQGTRASPLILPFLDEPELRATALFALEEVGGADLIPRIEPFLRDKNPYVRDNATRAILEIRRRQRRQKLSTPQRGD